MASPSYINNNKNAWAVTVESPLSLNPTTSRHLPPAAAAAAAAAAADTQVCQFHDTEYNTFSGSDDEQDTVATAKHGNFDFSLHQDLPALHLPRPPFPFLARYCILTSG